MKQNLENSIYSTPFPRVGEGLGMGADRYSYCFNNPLKYSDPGGYCAWKFEPAEYIATFGGCGPMGYQGYMGPGSSFHWSDGMNSYRDWKLMTSTTFNNFYGKGAYDLACDFDSNPATRDEWRSGRIDMNDVMTYYKYWNPIAGEEVYRTSEYKNGIHYVYIYCEGAWVSLNNQVAEGVDKGEGSVLGIQMFFEAVGLGGEVVSMSNSSFRLSSGANGYFSPKFYPSGWKGGSPARVTTYNVSKIGTGVSAGANLLTTGIAYYVIATGQQQSITYVDAGIGTTGIIASYASYFHGVEIPVVGEFVAIYGALRLSWDVGWYLGEHYGPSKWYGTDDTRWFK